ncbi:MAG: AtzG-like protein [Pseudomonadota bacterium]
MTESEVLAYVKASAVAQGLPLDEARALRVATHMARTAHLAALLDAAPLAVEDELAEIYMPKPFVAPAK